MDVLLSQFTYGVAAVLDQLLTLYLWIIIIAALLTWVNPDPRNPIVRFLYAVTEPALAQIRRRLPFVYAGGIDLSPIVLIAGILFVRIVLVGSLYRLGARMALASWLHVV